MDRHEWERPGAFEVAPGVHRIPLPLPGDHLKAVNVYAIADGPQVVLIDSGWAMADASEVLTTGLAGIGYALGDVREFLVTHVHRDHYTQAVALRRRFGRPVALGAGERVGLEAIIGGLNPEVHRQRVHHSGAVELARRLDELRFPPDTDWELPDRWLADGLDIELGTRTLRVIATPGHTSGHVVFHDAAAGVLFAGDHVLPHITPSIGMEPIRPTSPLRDYLTSLQLIRALPDTVLLPAHGPAAGFTHARVEELLAHHERRLDATLAAVAAGATSGFEAAQILTWTRHERRLDELDPANQLMAVQETMDHLQVLVEQGRVSVTDVDGIARFTLR